MRAAGFRPGEDLVTLDREKKHTHKKPLHSVRTFFCTENSIFFLSYQPSSLGEVGVFGDIGDVGERIFSRVEAMDGVIGVVGVELT